MSARSGSLDDSDKLLLRWSEDAFSPSREHLVQILEAGASEAVISSALKVDEKTKVYLIGKNSTESGIVRSCQAAGNRFIVTILFNAEDLNPPEGPTIDPGVLLLDSFMTEEQELKILDELDEEMRRQQCRSLAAAVAYLNTTRCEGTAVLNRLVKFTLRSSTALVSNGVVQVLGKFRQVAGTCAFARAQSHAQIGTAAVSPRECPAPAVSTPIQ